MRGHELQRHARRSILMAEHQSVAPPNSVDKIAGDLQSHHHAADTPHIIANLFWRQVWLGPGRGEDLSHGEVTVGMIKKELQELKLSEGQDALTVVVVDHSSVRIQP